MAVAGALPLDPGPIRHPPLGWNIWAGAWMNRGVDMKNPL